MFRPPKKMSGFFSALFVSWKPRTSPTEEEEEKEKKAVSRADAA
jgi:hypothetical protein